LTRLAVEEQVIGVEGRGEFLLVTPVWGDAMKILVIGGNYY
jgi:hypothetical protein